MGSSRQSCSRSQRPCKSKCNASSINAEQQRAHAVQSRTCARVSKGNESTGKLLQRLLWNILGTKAISWRFLSTALMRARGELSPRFSLDCSYRKDLICMIRWKTLGAPPMKTWSHPPGSNRRPADYEFPTLHLRYSFWVRSGHA